MSNIIRWDPMREVAQMRTALDRFFEDWAPFEVDNLGAGNLSLRLDIDENDQAYTLRTDMPGLKPEDIHVRQEGDFLLIEGELQEDSETGGDKKPLVRERRYGRYSRRVRLPEHIDVDHAEANYDHGVLTLTLPKAPNAPPKMISVKTGGSGS
ncbi:MAG TPA: Hsp20/alpha crystallin family protein [Candidatus Limnocylindrales bacterium]|jgi:HSP20 family protein|nr:Hsp20/alpha crystallin family protein [Candidatus Limnocylindrales bacterium]